jgi:hypothetical protein
MKQCGDSFRPAIDGAQPGTEHLIATFHLIANDQMNIRPRSPQHQQHRMNSAEDAAQQAAAAVIVNNKRSREDDAVGEQPAAKKPMVAPIDGLVAAQMATLDPATKRKLEERALELQAAWVAKLKSDSWAVSQAHLRLSTFAHKFKEDKWVERITETSDRIVFARINADGGLPAEQRAYVNSLIPVPDRAAWECASGRQGIRDQCKASGEKVEDYLRTCTMPTTTFPTPRESGCTERDYLELVVFAAEHDAAVIAAYTDGTKRRAAACAYLVSHMGKPQKHEALSKLVAAWRSELQYIEEPLRMIETELNDDDDDNDDDNEE